MLHQEKEKIGKKVSLRESERILFYSGSVARMDLYP